MSIGAIGGFDPTSFAVSSAMARKNNTSQPAAASPQTAKAPENDFLDYMKKSPGERMTDAWLQAHNLTKEKLDKMDPKERESIMKQMQEDITRQITDQAKAKTKVDILA